MTTATQHSTRTRTAPSTPAPQRVAPLYAGFGDSNGFCRLCNHGFKLTPTYGNPARCPACDVYMGGPGDVGRPVADAPADIVVTAPDLTPDARLGELVSTIADVLDAVSDAYVVPRADWATARRAIDVIAGYTDRGNTPVGDEGAWNILHRVADLGFYGRALTTADIGDAIDALDIIAGAPASLQTPAARQDFAAWCMSYGGDPGAFVTPASVGLTDRGGYRASDETSD